MMKKLILVIAVLALCVGCRQRVETADSTEGRSCVVLPEEDASGFVLLTDIIPDALLEVRYYSTYNFVGARIDGYDEPIVLLTRAAADSLARVEAELRAQGYRIKVYDGYRPQMAVDHFVRWAENLTDTFMKPYFYPELTKAELFPKDFICERSGHTRGSTVDLTLFDMAAGKDVDMGGNFDYFGALSHPDNQNDITHRQYQNRMLLREAMLRHGFVPYDEEWWHFTLANEPYPDTYFTFPLQASKVK